MFLPYIETMYKRSVNMKLYLIHTGFYDPKIMDGLYEQHTNYFVVANDLKTAKIHARNNLLFKKKKMHIDGIQELNVVDGYRIQLVKDKSSEETLIFTYEDVKSIKICDK